MGTRAIIRRRGAGPAATFAALLALGAVPPAAPAARAPAPSARTAGAAAQPFFDARRSRTATASGRRQARTAGLAGTERTRDARAALRRRLGRQGAISIDPVTGTPRAIVRLDGPVAGPEPGDRALIAERWVRDNAAALGLDAADLTTFGDPDLEAAPRGTASVRLTQAFRGIPAFDNGLQLGLDAGGRVTSVTGSPRHDLRVDSTVPLLDAPAALARLMADVGVRRDVEVESGPAGARRTTRFADGDRADLVLFGGASVRLAWRVTYRATSTAWYDAVVDARTGDVLRRVNIVKHAAEADVFPNYPGAPAGGAVQRVDLEALGHVHPDATTLFDSRNAYARTFSDLDDDDFRDSGEDVLETSGSFLFPFTPFTCGSVLCGWSGASNSWRANREQNAAQAHWLVSNFHDHLERAPISFDDFEGPEAVRVHTDDGATTGTGGNRPNNAHLSNANMATPLVAGAPIMQMYLFASPFRTINGGDDAATVYHEYTHGLTTRLIGALNSDHGGAIGEGLSDWYAEDYLVRQNLETDVPGQAGDIDIGKYSDAFYGATRRQALDCRVGVSDPKCPGGSATGPGGFTLGDFAKVENGPEVHGDGEIWAEAMWDLRAALVQRDGALPGSDLAEALITGGLRQSPDEPSFLDMRDAILAADTALHGGANRDLIWEAFRARGMGFNARATSGDDVAPLEDFTAPPSLPPAGSLAVSPGRAAVNETVRFDASSFRDPDGTLESFAWDFDGDGTADRTTSTPATEFAYPSARGYVAQVKVRSVGGGTGEATAAVEVVVPPPAPQPTPSPTPAPAPTVAPPLPRARPARPVAGRITATRRTRRSVRVGYGTLRATSARVRIVVGGRTIGTRTIRVRRDGRFAARVEFRRSVRKRTSVTVEILLRGPGGSTKRLLRYRA